MEGIVIRFARTVSIFFSGALLVLAVPTFSTSAEPPSVAAAKGEFAVLTGYGITHKGFGSTNDQVQTFDAILRFGRFLSDELGKNSWYQGRHEVFVELPLHVAVDHEGRIMTGAYLLGSYKFTGLAERRLFPYVFGGGGVLYVDLGLPDMGSRLDFNYQGGTGIQYLLREGFAVQAEYRYHHVSNANIAHPNEALNSSKFLIGISFLK
jgi:lipid A 3-O-deacylase